MKNYKIVVLLLLLIPLFQNCEDTWQEHYGSTPETVDQSVWDVIKSDNNLSVFVSKMEEFGLDSIFVYDTLAFNDVYTLFIPSNAAFENFEGEVNRAQLAYHIMKYYLLPRNVDGTKKVQTILLKFAQFENKDGALFFDRIPIEYTSPLYANGRYFVINEISHPLPNLYEYIKFSNTALKKYIDEQDSIVLDKELSTPIGFDDFGNTVYDSVIDVINLFEEEFFEVSKEFRLKTATLVFPKQDTYNEALTEMALKIGSGYTSYEDIAEEWQQEVLIPYLLGRGVFENQMEPVEFQRDTLINILGERIILDYRPTDLAYCSNGYAYDYAQFTIEDTLFMNPIRNEAERLLKYKGQNTYVWQEDVTVVSDKTFKPEADFVNIASNDSILKVQFDDAYEGEFSVEFESEPLFPRRYLFVVRTHMDFGGIYDIYVNDELVKTFDYNDFTRYRGIIQSAVPGIRFIAVGRYNKFDFWVDNITEYGRAKIRFEYRGPSTSRYNGLLLDYISCVPENMTETITQNP